MTHSKRPLFTSGGGGTPLSPSSASSLMKKTKPHHAAAFFAPVSEKSGRRIAGDDDDAMLVDQDSGQTLARRRHRHHRRRLQLLEEKGHSSPALREAVARHQDEEGCPLSSRCNPTIPSNFEDNTWATLKSAITAIFMKKSDPCDSEALFFGLSVIFVCTRWQEKFTNVLKRSVKHTYQQSCSHWSAGALIWWCFCH